MKKESAVIGIVVLIFVAVVVGRINLPRYFLLSRQGLVTVAHITAKEPENHRLIRYSFVVNGENYNGVQGVSDEINKINVGQQIQIRYYSLDPTVNCYCEPKTMLISESVVVSLASVVAAGFVGLFLHFWPRYRGRSKGDRISP